MAGVIGILAVVALIVWVAARPRRERDDTPVADPDELEAAERELADDGAPRELGAEDDEDDWGPGAPSR